MIKTAPYKGPHTTYAEVGQTNPLRFVILYKEGDGFAEQTKEFRCKDFFNEVVAKLHGHILGCYGFTADSIQTNEEGVYVELRHLVNKDVYAQNIESINKLVAQDGLPTLELLPSTNGFVTLLPSAYFRNTYLVSLLTYYLRIANVGEVVKDWHNHPTKAIDNPFSAVYDRVMKGGFKMPKETGTYFYSGKGFDYTKKPDVYNVHNCGVAQWTTMLMAEKAI